VHINKLIQLPFSLFFFLFLIDKGSWSRETAPTNRLRPALFFQKEREKEGYHRGNKKLFPKPG